MSELDKYYQILGLNPGASEKEIKEAYRDLVNVWHPDRFSDNPRLREKANEKTKEINLAYEKLKSCIAGETSTTSEEKSCDESQPPPHEPPPQSEKDQDTTTDDTGQGDFEPPPEQPSGRPQPHVVESIYAGFWNRFAASFIDSLIIAAASTMLSLPYLIAKGLSRTTSSSFWVVFDSIFFMLIGWLYYTVLESSTKRATIGKMAVGIIVTDINGNRISFGHASGRWLGKIISFLILGIGYIMAGFTQKKQALHDIMADTLVLERPEGVRSWLATTIIGGQAVILLIAIPLFLINLNRQYTRIRDDTQTVSARSSHFLKEQQTLTQPPSETAFNAADWYDKGNSYSQSGSYKDAVDAFSMAIELNPNFMEAYQNRGVANYYLKEFSQAISDFNKAIELKPDSLVTLTSRGNVNQVLGQYRLALKDFEKVIMIKPEYPHIFLDRGITYEKIGDYENAIKDYNKAVELNPNDEEARNYRQRVSQIQMSKQASEHLSRAIVYSQDGQHDKAIGELTMAISLDPNNAMSYFKRGIAFSKKGQYDKAIEDFTKAISADDKLELIDLVYYDRGLAYHKIKQYDKAIIDLNKAVYGENAHMGYLSLGNVYDDKGEHDKAIENYTQAIYRNQIIQKPIVIEALSIVT